MTEFHCVRLFGHRTSKWHSIRFIEYHTELPHDTNCYDETRQLHVFDYWFNSDSDACVFHDRMEQRNKDVIFGLPGMICFEMGDIGFCASLDLKNDTCTRYNAKLEESREKTGMILPYRCKECIASEMYCIVKCMDMNNNKRSKMK